MVVFNSTNRQNFRLVQIEAYAEDKINVTEKLKFALGRVENIVGKFNDKILDSTIL